MKKKIFKILLIIILVIVFILLCSIGKVLYENRLIYFKSVEYGVSIKYPAKYDEKSSNRLLEAKDDNSGLLIAITGVEESTDISLEEIIERYINTLKIFNREYDTKIEQSSQVDIDGAIAGKVVAVVTGNKFSAKSVIILIPLENKQITISISGNENIFNNKIDEIEKIISSIKIY